MRIKKGWVKKRWRAYFLMTIKVALFFSLKKYLILQNIQEMSLNYKQVPLHFDSSMASTWIIPHIPRNLEKVPQPKPPSLCWKKPLNTKSISGQIAPRWVDTYTNFFIYILFIYYFFVMERKIVLYSFFVSLKINLTEI